MESPNMPSSPESTAGDSSATVAAIRSLIYEMTLMDLLEKHSSLPSLTKWDICWLIFDSAVQNWNTIYTGRKLNIFTYFRLRKEWEEKRDAADELQRSGIDDTFLLDYDRSQYVHAAGEQISSPPSSSSALLELCAQQHDDLQKRRTILSDVEKSLGLFAEVKILEEQLRAREVCILFYSVFSFL